jgi:hypothetical protein
MVIGEIESAWNLGSKILKILRNKKNKKEGDVASRFLSVFENHGVTRSQIPIFFQHGLTITDTKNAESLFNKLDDEMLTDVCKLFAVRKEWLDGVDEQIYPQHDFYKQPEAFANFISRLLENKKAENFTAHVIASVPRLGRSNIAFILEEKIGSIGERYICRSHVCGDWDNYWGSIAYLTACLAITRINGIYVRHGRRCRPKELQRYLVRDKFLLNSQNDLMSDLKPVRVKLPWYPEDMVDRPDVYLNEIDPELDNFAYKAGLNTWLELFDEGWMNVGPKHDSSRSNFESALRRLEKK